jgi:ParB family chromosome partitioning protein
MPLRKIAAIRVGARFRQDLGDLPALAASIADLGLLQPVVVSPAGDLIAGARRLRAVQLLGWKTVPVHVVRNLHEAAAALQAERDENTCRKAFTPSEAVALERELERLQRPEARARQRAGTSRDGTAGGRGRRKNPLESYQEVSGATRDRVGAAVGMSGRTFEKARAVVEAGEREPGRFAKLRELMDRTRRVDGVYRRLQVLRQAQALAAEPPPLPRGPFRVMVVDPPWHYAKRAGDPSQRGQTPYPPLTRRRPPAAPETP